MVIKKKKIIKIFIIAKIFRIPRKSSRRSETAPSDGFTFAHSLVTLK